MTFRSSEGFTLVEVIIAFAILALSVGLLHQGYGTSIHALAVADAKARAVVLAQSKLAEIGAVSAFAVGRTEGVSSDGTRWSITIGKHGKAKTEPVQQPLQAYDVVVDVFWGPKRSARNFQLRSVKLLIAQ